ncbi:MAG: glycosyltransferase family 2 protein [Chloroflexi bacterium]|nr:glycosyltransferase family 2 protein [Chloroflexota bacterium]
MAARERPGPTVTVAVVALNEAELIEGCLVSAAWADELLVIVDAATTDATVTLAEAHGARVVTRPWRGWPNQRNAALDLASSDWVLFLDGDERITPALAQEVRRTLATAGETAGCWVPRRNVIAGEWVKHAGWWPDRQLRLLRRTAARYDEGVSVHEVATLDGPDAILQEPMLHLNYDSLTEFREKQARFAKLEAATLWEHGIRPRPHSVVLQPIREFRRRTVELGGIRQGPLGLRLGAEMAYAAFQTYRELLRMKRAEQTSTARERSTAPA